jgi:hypothetical protein
LWKHFANILRAFCQQLPVEAWRGANECKEILAPLWLRLIVKYIGERSAKNTLSPSMRGLEQI